MTANRCKRIKDENLFRYHNKLAALILVAVILGICVFSNTDKGSTAPEIIISESIFFPTSPEHNSEQPSDFIKPTPIHDISPTDTTAHKTNATAFQLKIKGKTISVAYGVEESTLKMSPGWLISSARPGEDGMCVVYGHRNRTHLRVLEDVKTGDTITVTTEDGTVYTYTVSDIQIYEKTADLRLPTKDGKTLGLITCYPFRYAGNAPGRCVVIGINSSK